MSHIKKIWKFLSSMKFAVILLLLLVAACALGSFIPQRQTLDWYFAHYSTRTAALIVGTCFDDVFRSPWFLILAVVLCGNLLLCNLLRLPELIRRWRRAGDPEQVLNRKPTVTLEGLADPEPVFTGLRMPKPRCLEQEGRELRFSGKNRIGYWGAWVCHLGVLLLILGVLLGQSTRQEYVVSGLPGETVAMGDSGYLVTLEDFRVEYTDSGMPSQYTSVLTMTDPQGRTQRGTASVNRPAELFGYRIYQNSTGSAARLTLRMNDTELTSAVLKEGEGIQIHNLPLIAYYLGRAEDPELGTGFRFSVYDTRSGTEDVYFQPDGTVGITFGPMEGIFSDPEAFTVLQIKRDSYTGLVLAGGLITLLGLILAFYLQPKRVWALREADGTWTLRGESPKGGALFARQLRQAAGLPESEPKKEEEPRAEG